MIANFIATNTEDEVTPGASGKTNISDPVPVVHRTGIKHQATATLFRLESTGTDKTSIEDELLVFCFIASICHENGKARVMYMQTYDV